MSATQDQINRCANNALAQIIDIRDDLGEAAMMEVIMSQTAANAMAAYQTFGPDAIYVLDSMHLLIRKLEDLIAGGGGNERAIHMGS